MKYNFKIGYACTPISIPYKTSRSFTLKNFSEERFFNCVKENLSDLMSILKWNIENNIFMFRVSSDIIPFGSHEINNIKWWEIFNEELLMCGEFIKETGMRVSMHPGQYTVLNSLDMDIVNRAKRDIEYHCRFMDSMNLDYTHKIVLHVGGVYGDKKLATQRCIENFSLLSESSKKRLVLENDDKSYTIEEVLKICGEIKVPAVFDNLHHRLNPCNLEIGDILKRVSKTWKPIDGRMKLHYSDKDEEKKGGAHSKFVISKNFIEYLNIIGDLEADIMLEVKDKELSVIKCINLLSGEVNKSERYSQWAKYKYLVMEKNYAYYKKCSSLVNSDSSMVEVYLCIDEAMKLPFSEGNFINTAEHVYGYVKDKVSEKEKTTFRKLLEVPLKDPFKIKEYLKRLSNKYEVNYLLQSYYFIY